MALTKIPGSLIEAGAITAASLNDDAVTTDKVLDANITHAKLHATMDLTGKTVTVATASGSTNTTAVASTAFVQQELTTLIGGAPSTLNDLNELAAAINDDANYNSTLTTALATKLPLAGGELSGTLNITQASTADTIKLTRSTTAQNNMIKFRSAGADKWIVGQRNDSTEHFRFYSYGTSSDVLSISTDGNIGIGETTPLGKLHVKEGDSGQGSVNSNFDQLVLEDDAHSGMTILSGTSSDGGIYFGDSGGNNLGQFKYKHGSNSFTFATNNGNESLIIDSAGDVRLAANATGAALIKGVSGNQTDRNTGGYPQFTFVGNEGTGMRRPITNILALDTSGAERMRIDASGNVLVGKTATGIATVGAELKPTGELLATVSGDACAFLNRKTSDGDIINFRKDGSTMGQIGTYGGTLYIGSGSGGVMFNGAEIEPTTGAASRVDGAVDLGTTSYRFKHLRFSGGLYGGSEVRTNAVGIGTTPAGSSVGRTTSAPDGIFWHNGGGLEDYSIHRTAGAWSGSNYQQLKLDWDTGIIIDGGTAYGKSGVHIHGNISMGDSTYSNFTSPNYPVHICAANYSLMIESSTGYGHLGSNNTSYFHFGGNRNFYFDNRCEASGGFHTYSDENLKKEITVIPSALNKVAQMNGVTFKWKDAVKRGGGDAGKQFGVTAQNMLEIDSELPTKNVDPLYNIEDSVSADDEYYTMDYNRITPFLIEAVKELKTKLEAAEARITTLEG